VENERQSFAVTADENPGLRWRRATIITIIAITLVLILTLVAVVSRQTWWAYHKSRSGNQLEEVQVINWGPVITGIDLSSLGLRVGVPVERTLPASVLYSSARQDALALVEGAAGEAPEAESVGRHSGS
jgi:hypothetical protein